MLSLSKHGTGLFSNLLEARCAKRSAGRRLFGTGLFLIALAPAASAHTFAPALLDLRERDPGVFDVVWKVPPTAAESGLGDSGELVPELPPHCQRLASPGSNSSEDGSTYWRADCRPAGLRGERLIVSGLEGNRTDVLIRITWHDGQMFSGVLRSGSDTLAIPNGVTSAGAGATPRAVLWSYTSLGIAHILRGADHLLFVLGLLLLVPKWRVLIKAISAFTLGHSLSLAVAVLGLITVPSAPVEVLIAVSIILIAAELTRAPDAPLTLSRRYPWLVAFGFGLFHGLGFAGALAEIGLPPGQVALALFGFNVGVEVGQVAFVLAMLVPVTVWIRLVSVWPTARLVPAYAIGTVATAWAIARMQQFWVHTL